MAHELEGRPEWRQTIERLEAAKRVSATGAEYWMAREIAPILGYLAWDKFEPVIERARRAFEANGITSANHIAQTSKMVEIGSGSQRSVTDHYLTRAACYLIAMNGDSSKPEIAAAQAYFAIQTRKMEVIEATEAKTADEKRLDLREKVSTSVKRVSKVAQEAGVRNALQGVFHGKRYEGLYGMSLDEVRALKGITGKDQLLDRAGLLELSMHDFQMNLAADVIGKDTSPTEAKAIRTNKEVAERVRRSIIDSKATLPENLPLEPPIKEIKKRIGGTKLSLATDPSTD